jgi:cytochrome c553
MKGIIFPASNVIFAAQRENPADVKPAKDPSTATDALDGSYGKWEAVENSALALAEAANLLILPGRKCTNGLDVPWKNPDWYQLVQGLREAAMTAYKAAQSKNQDKMVDAAATINAACANCHDRYRVANDLLPLVEKADLADRCK